MAVRVREQGESVARERGTSERGARKRDFAFAGVGPAVEWQNAVGCSERQT